MKLKKLLALFLAVLILMPTLEMAVLAAAYSDFSLKDTTVTYSDTGATEAKVSFVTNVDYPLVAFQGVFSSESEQVELIGFEHSENITITANDEENVATGNVLWEASTPLALSANDNVWTAVFSVKEGTPVGKYEVKLNLTYMTDGDTYETVEGEYSATIEVKEPEEEVDPDAYNIYYKFPDTAKDTAPADNFYEVEPGGTIDVQVWVSANSEKTMQAFDIYPKVAADGPLSIKSVAAANGFAIANNLSDAKPHFMTNITTENTGNIDKKVGVDGVHVATLTLELSTAAVYDTHYSIWFDADMTNLSQTGTIESVGTVNVTAEGVTGVETLKTYTVTYKPGTTDAVTDMPDPATAQKPHNATLTLSDAEPKRTGYNFLGWSTTEGASQAEYAKGATVAADKLNAEGTILYAVWEANTRTVIWYNYDGTKITETEETYNTRPTYSVEPNFTKEGYIATFQGWATSKEQSVGSKVNDLPAVTEDNTEYYAAFTFAPITYTIVLDPNGGEGTPVRIENVKYGENVTLPLNTFTKTGYSFAGAWNTDPDGKSGQVATDGGTYNSLISVDGGEYTLYAVWNINSYDVTFSDDGKDTIERKEYNSQIELPAPAGKTGYIFSGWYDGNDRVGGAGDIYTVTKEVTLTAKYDPIKYHVEFDLNGVTIEGEKPDKMENVEYDKEITMPTITAAGKTFAGWKHGDEIYSAGEKKTNLTTENDATVTLVAQWTTNNWQVFSDSTVQNGTVSAKNEVEASGTSANMGDTIVVTLTPATGYQMKAGSLKYIATDDQGNALSGAQYVDITTKNADGNYTFMMPDSCVKVTAEFEQIDYTVKVDTVTNGTVTLGTDEEAEITANYQDTITVKVTPEDGYELETLKYTVDGEEKNITATDGAYTFEMPAGNVTVSATFVEKYVTITFDTDGGSTIQPITQKYKSDVTAPTDPTKTGYTFDGWDPEIPAIMPAKDMKITAKWTVNKYKVNFLDGENGTPVQKETEVEYGASITVPTNPTKTGYTFAAWSPAIPETMPAEDQTFVATWIANKYEVTLDPNQGSFAEGAATSFEVTFDDTYNGLNSMSEPSRNGYDFAGWQYNGTDITASTKVTVADNHTLTAKWTGKEYTVTFDPNNGTATTTEKFKTDTGFTTPATPTNTNTLLEFGGWYITARAQDGNWPDLGHKYDGKTKITEQYGDVTLTAKWNPIFIHKVEEYKYAPANYAMLLIKTTTENASSYKFGEQEMYYTDNEHYLWDGSPVLVTLIPESYVQVSGDGFELTDAGIKQLSPAESGAAEIVRDGKINTDDKVNIADANAVYQMIINESIGGYYSIEQLGIYDRLVADMNPAVENVADHRGSIADVNAIVTIINQNAN